MKQKMTIVRIDASETDVMANLTLVAIHRGIQFTYITETNFYDCDDAFVFLTDKFTLLGCIEKIKDYTSMSDDDKDTIWNVVQFCGEEVEGEISLDVAVVKKVSLFNNKGNMVENMRNATKKFLLNFDDAGYGMYNLNIGSNDKLSFDNSQGMIFQIYPYEKECPIWILNYHDDDHGDIAWSELDNYDQKIIYKMFMDSLNEK